MDLRSKQERAPINDSINKPKLKFGLDYRVLGICVFSTVLLFVFGARVFSLFFLCLSLGIGKWLTRNDARYLDILLFSFVQSSSYDPGKGQE